MKRLLFALMLFIGLSAPIQAADLMIKSFSPKGDVKGRPVISVTFTEAMVAQNQVGKTLAGNKIPLRIRPALEGTAVWAAPDRLEFRPKQDIPVATEYFVDFGPGGIKSHKGKLLAGPQSFTFRTEPLKWLTYDQVNYTNNDEIVVVLNFTAPVTPQRLTGFLTLKDQDGSLIQYRIDGNKPSKDITIVTNSAPDVKTLFIELAAGLKADVGTLSTEEVRTGELEVKRIVEVTNAYASTNSEQTGSITIQLTSSVDIDTVKGHVSLSPNIPFTVNSSWRGFVINGEFAPRSRVSLTIKKGLGGADGLQKDYTRDFIFPDLSPQLEFGSAGLFLTPAEEPRIALEAVNINEISVSLHRVYNNNLPLILSYVNSWEQENLVQWSKHLETKKFLLNGMQNERTRRAINLNLFDEKPSGLYLIRANAEDEDAWSSDTALVNISDMALSAKTYRQGMQIWASSISKAEPIVDGKVTIYSSKNQLLAQGVTDKDGLLTLLPEMPWADDMQPAIAVLEKDDDITFVLLIEDQLASRGIDTAGAPWPDGAEALWMLPRNIWQPGETLQAEMILRDVKGLPVKAMPLRWVLTSQRLDVASGVITPNELGTAGITVELPAAMAAGPAQLRLQIPGKDVDLANRTIQIEEFRPPQIEVEFINPPKVLLAKEETNIEFQSRYLFGAPASDLDWQCSYSATPLQWESKAHPGYFFGARETEKLGRPRGDLNEDSLDTQGQGSVQWNSDILSPSLGTPMDVFLRLNVMEKGGRWTGKTLRLPWLPDNALVGVLPPKDWVKPRQKCTLPVVVIDSEDKPLERTLTVVVSQVHDRWTMVTENGRSRMTWQEDVVEKSRHELDVKGKGSFSFTPPEEGRWQIDFIAGEFTTSIRVSAWNDGQITSLTGPENLTLSTGQKNFKAGESATISVKSPFAGTLFVATGNDTPLSLQRLQLNGTEGTFTVSTEGMEPNGWCIAAVTRPGSMETKPPYRAIGALPLVMDLERSKLTITVTGPEQIEPGPLGLSFTVKNQKGEPVDGVLSVALVDRGILGLTYADNQDPWSWFTRLRRSEGLLADIFDQIRPNEDRATALLHPAGGAEETARMMSANADLYSPVSAADYKPMSLWFMEVPVKNGEASLHAEIPEFSGSLRIEALAYSPVGLGRGTSRVNVARPLMIQGTMPRYVTPGDEFKPHIQLFSSLKGDGTLTVTLSEGLTFANGEKEHKGAVTFKNGKAEMVLPALKVASDSGTARLEVQLTVGDQTVAEKYSIANRPGSPRVTHSGGDKVEGTANIEFPGEWFPGTGATSVTLAGSPVTDATRLLNVVGTWGSRIEWLTAQTWAALSLPQILNDQELINEDEVNMHIPSLLFTIQALQNHDGSWSRWSHQTGDIWASASVMHLMTALKRAGVNVEHRTWSSGLRYLRSVMNETLPDSEKEKRMNLDGRAYSCFVLASAGEAPLGWMNWLGDQATNLSADGNALLSAAWATTGNRERAATLLGGDVASPKRQDKSDRFWISDTRTLAFRLLAHESIAPGSTDGRNTAERISTNLHGKDLFWIDSETGGLILMALAVFAEHNPASGGSAVLTNATGEEVLRFTGENPASWFGTNGTPLKLTTEDGAVWYSWTSSGVPVTPTKPFAKGIEVTAQLLDANGNPVKNKTLQFGQQVSLQVTARIRTPQPAVRLSILLPGGLEAEEAGSAGEKQSGTVRADKRFDRVILNALNAGKAVTWTVPCRAVFRGKFNVPSVTVDVPANPGMGALGQPDSLIIN